MDYMSYEELKQHHKKIKSKINNLNLKKKQIEQELENINRDLSDKKKELKNCDNLLDEKWEIPTYNIKTELFR